MRGRPDHGSLRLRRDHLPRVRQRSGPATRAAGAGTPLRSPRPSTGGSCARCGSTASRSWVWPLRSRSGSCCSAWRWATGLAPCPRRDHVLAPDLHAGGAGRCARRLAACRRGSFDRRRAREPPHRQKVRPGAARQSAGRPVVLATLGVPIDPESVGLPRSTARSRPGAGSSS